MAVGTTAVLLGASALVSTAGSIFAGAQQASAAEKAAGVQEKSANDALALQQEGLDFTKSQAEQARTDGLPWMEAGKTALTSYMGELGLSDEAQAGTFESQFEKTPGYAHQVQEGESAIVNNLAALGMRGSGSALKSLTDFRMGIADQGYNNYLNRLSGVAGGGQAQAANNNSLAANTSAGVNNSLVNMGQTVQNAGAARASGYVGGANAWSNAISNTTKAAGTALGMYSALNNPNGNALSFNWG